MSIQQDSHWYLREWRKALNLTGEQLGALVNKSKGRISELENGKQRWNVDDLLAFAAALNIHPAELLFRNPSEPDHVLALWARISPERQQVALDMLRALAEPRG